MRIRKHGKLWSAHRHFVSWRSYCLPPISCIFYLSTRESKYKQQVASLTGLHTYSAVFIECPPNRYINSSEKQEESLRSFFSCSGLKSWLTNACLNLCDQKTGNLNLLLNLPSLICLSLPLLHMHWKLYWTSWENERQDCRASCLCKWSAQTLWASLQLHQSSAWDS